MELTDPDIQMRLAAFDRVQKLSQIHERLTAKELNPGFIFERTRHPLVNPQRGIFKPRQMKYLLSIKTVYPRSGAKIWYDDQRKIHQQIFKEEESVDYAFMGNDPNAADNRWLREAFENQIPIIYFLGVAPGYYQAILPVFISAWDAKTLTAKIVFGISDQEELEAPQDAAERQYALRTVKQRLHQAVFREAVIGAYMGRCAFSGLPEQRLLDAAHIISDKHETLGQLIVPNGLPLSKTHHAAFDAHMLGIDPDYRLHVSDHLLVQNDGPQLELLKQLHKQKLHLPKRLQDYPDRDRLAQRFKTFLLSR